MSGKRTLRCAVYTRKSTEDGLEQEFNSLDAQREACEAYIASQASLGWKLISTRYDDGGLSGGTMDRPALQRLLDDIKQGHVDVVVVYKIDRLTRSLMDFARIVEVFDASEVSFVSVTQQFNTTTSMGRLTLNVLLSFAQFEREVTAERIRDKIAASKKKGIWMGGPTPLGYDVKDKCLVINEPEAETVRLLFRLYLEEQSVRVAKARADALGIVTKQRVRRDGMVQGSKPFSRGNLYQLLSNPIYIGEIAHRGQIYPGRHEGIIDKTLWDEVQTTLAKNAQPRRSTSNGKSICILTGLLFDETGDRMSPTHATKNGVRYRYYISNRLMTGAQERDDGWRLPAKEIERPVLDAIRNHLGDPFKLTGLLGSDAVTANEHHATCAQASGLAQRLNEALPHDQKQILASFVDRIEFRPDCIVISIDLGKLAGLLSPEPGNRRNVVGNAQDPRIRRVELLHTIQRRGVEAKLVLNSGHSHESKIDKNLIMTIAKVHLWHVELTTGITSSIDELARQHGEDRNEISRFLSLAYLAPEIVDAIVTGKQLVDLTREKLRGLVPLPSDWSRQRTLLVGA